MAWMPLPTASQCAIVVSVEAITVGRSIHVRSYNYRYRLGKAGVALPFNLRRDAFGDNFCP
jgi:hypothetical protein